MSGLTGEINWADLVDDEGVDGAPGGRHRLSSVGTDSSHQSHGETSTGDKGVPTDATGLDIATSLPHGPPYRMFVGQVPFEAEATHVARFFESKGCKVSQESCAMNKHQDGSRKCSAFIDILDEESVMRALSLTDTRMMDPANRDKYRKVRIEVARKPKPSGDRDGHNRERRNNNNKGHQQNGGRGGGGIMFQNKDQQNQRGGGRGGGTGGRNQRGGIFGKGKNAPAVSDDDFMDFRTRGTASSQPRSGTDHENSSKAEQQKQHQHGDPTESGEPKTRTSLKLKPRQKKEGQEDSDPARSGRDETLFGGARPNNVNYLDKPETATRAPPTSEKHKGEQLSSNREKQEGTGASRGKGRGGNRRGGRGGGKPSGNKGKESRGDSGDKPGKTKQSKRTIPMAQAKVPSEEERLAKQQEEMHKAAGNNNFAALGMMDSDEESGSDAE